MATSHRRTRQPARRAPSVPGVLAAAAVLLGGIAGGGVAVAAGAGSDPKVPQTLTPAQLSESTPPPPRAGRVVSRSVATNAHCGQVLTASLTLNGDLVCSASPALTLKGNSITLNLNGHGIGALDPSDHAGIGVKCSGNTDTIKNGTVSGFGTNVEIRALTEGAPAPSGCTITGVTSTDSYTGIADRGNASKITNNSLASQSIGIYSTGGAGAVITGNHLSDTLYNGIAVTNVLTSTVTNNVLTDSGLYGIYVYGGTGKLGGNIVENNAEGGITAYSISATDLGNNVASDNGVVNATTGAQCFNVTCVAP